MEKTPLGKRPDCSCDIKQIVEAASLTSRVYVVFCDWLDAGARDVRSSAENRAGK